MTDIRYDRIGDSIIAALPELSEEYAAEMKWWGNDEPGSHTIISNVLTPFLTKLADDRADPELTRRAFSFVEQLANHPDMAVQELVAFSICEELGGGDANVLRALRPHMGPATLEWCRKVQRFWRRKERLL